MKTENTQPQTFECLEKLQSINTALRAENEQQKNTLAAIQSKLETLSAELERLKCNGAGQ